MKKELIIYGFSVGINRGAILILMPFLLHIFSVQDFGLFSYVQLLFQLISPIISLNIIVAMSREGADNPAKALYIYNKFLAPLVLITLSLSGLCYLLTWVNLESIYVWILLLAGVEAWHNMLLNYYRAVEKNWIFLFFSLAKTLGLLIVYWIFHSQKPDAILDHYLLLQLIWAIFIGVIFHILIKSNIKNKILVPLKDAIISSVILIPHTLALWIIASTGRFFMKELLGNYELGIYSKVFNVAMVLMIINSGIGIALPQQIIKNYSNWITGNLRYNYFKYYSLATVILYLSLLSGIWIDNNYLHLYKIDFDKYGFDFMFIFIGFYFLGYYYVYSNILFALRKNKTLALITTFTAILSVIVNYILIYNFRMVGASISVLTIYFLYYILTYIYAKKYEAKFRSDKTEIIFLVSVLLMLFVLTNLFGSTIY